MTREAQELFAAVVDRSEPERRRIYAQRRTPDALRAEVESLLAFDAGEDGLLTSLVAAPANELAGAGRLEEGAAAGPFRLVRPLGQGGMGAVYLAERCDGEIRQRAAVKFLRWDIPDGVFRERFLRERQILAELDHPGIARLLDAGHTATGQPFLAMEYVEGVPLDNYAAQLDVRGKVELILQVCAAVSYLHTNLVIHRDLKPSNILVDARGRTKLLDFGIAKVLDATALAGATREVLLTPEYASPEQVQGAAQTTATDVYSIGAVLYALVSGASPHAGLRDAATTLDEAIVQREPPPPSRLNRGVPRDLDFILARALRKRPADRYSSVEALADDLRALLEHRPVRARQGDALYRLSRWARRHWIPALAATVTIAALTAGLVVARRERAIAETRFDQVRNLVQELFALDQEIRGLAGSTQARHHLVSTALRYLEGLSRSAARDPAMALEAGAAYSRVAQIQGVPTRNNLGRFAEAESTLIEAQRHLELAQRAMPRNRRVLLELFRVSQFRMILADSTRRNSEALSHARMTVARIEQLEQLGRPHASEVEDIALAYSNVALFHSNANRFSEAVRLARRAVQLEREFAPHGAAPSGALGILGNALRFQGDLEAAAAITREAREQIEASGNPGDTRTQFNLAAALWREAAVLGSYDGISLGRHPEAIALLEREVAILERLSQTDPRESTSRLRTATAVRELAPLLAASEPDRALRYYDLGLRRLGEVPGNPTARRQESDLLAASAAPLRQLGQGREASRRIAAAVSALEKAGGLPKESLEAGSEAERILRAEADDLAARGHAGEAAAKYERLLALALAGQISPEANLRHAASLSRILRGVARTQRLAGNLERAEQISRRNLELWRGWAGRLPANPFITSQIELARR